mmetsp:Transcript_17777/g.28968  ORF Transcript_17777/g.28968 Transcript_17777/m.28968 type:complete len:362 (-) Transcript_17777:24-1109(-)
MLYRESNIAETIASKCSGSRRIYRHTKYKKSRLPQKKPVCGVARMLPCVPLAKANKIAAFSAARCGQASRRSMTFCTTLQTFPSAVNNALAIIPRTWLSSGSPTGDKRVRAKAAASRKPRGNSNCWQAVSKAWKSPVVTAASRTDSISSGINSSICNMDATCTKRKAVMSSVASHRSVKPCSCAAPSASAAKRAIKACSTAIEHPNGMKTCTRHELGSSLLRVSSTKAPLPVVTDGGLHSLDKAEVMYGILAATLLVNKTSSTVFETPLSSSTTFSCATLPSSPHECFASSRFSPPTATSSFTEPSSCTPLQTLTNVCTSKVINGGRIVFRTCAYVAGVVLPTAALDCPATATSIGHEAID